DAGDHERSAALDHPLNELPVGGADHQAKGHAEPDRPLVHHETGQEGDRSHRHAGGPRRAHDPEALHRVNSLIFNQTAAAPAARPTKSPMSTKTGDVWKAASSPTPPRIGSRTAPAK